MKKQLLFRFLASFFFSVIIYGCQPKEPVTVPYKKVRYEITGNYTGQFVIVYNNNVSGNTTLTNVQLPWSIDLSYDASIVLAAGIGAQSSVAGVAGQTAVMKIIVDGTVVKSSNATAGSFGEMLLPALAHSF